MLVLLQIWINKYGGMQSNAGIQFLIGADVKDNSLQFLGQKVFIF